MAMIEELVPFVPNTILIYKRAPTP